MTQINIKELLQLSNPIIIDIRNNYYYNKEHIKGSINIPYYNLLNNYNHYLTKNKKYYLYCNEGEQSLEISTRLNSFGYNTASIQGGYQEYKRLFL